MIDSECKFYAADFSEHVETAWRMLSNMGMNVIGGQMIKISTPCAMVLLAVCSQAANSQELHLICIGGGTAYKQVETTARAGAIPGDTAPPVTTFEQTVQVPFQDQVNIDITGEKGRIRFPATMTPWMHGGDSGYFPLKNVKSNELEITAKAAINFMYSAKVRLDRTTGRLLISGISGTFSGDCEPYDPSTAQKKF